MNVAIAGSGAELRHRVGEIDLLHFLAALVVVLFHYGFRGYAVDNLSSVMARGRALKKHTP